MTNYVKLVPVSQRDFANEFLPEHVCMFEPNGLLETSNIPNAKNRLVKAQVITYGRHPSRMITGYELVNKPETFTWHIVVHDITTVDAVQHNNQLWIKRSTFHKQFCS